VIPARQLTPQEKLAALNAQNMANTIMPKKGDPTAGVDVGGGLETVPGVTKNGKAVQNYRPGWTLTFDQEAVPGVPEASFKFYRQPGSGNVQ